MATKSPSLTVPAREKAEPDCHCGCAPCDGSCCQLDCIVKPRFFCGQLLTDADLSALLKWARDRFGLSRYRHGWGVVCGLDVRCDAQNATGVIVTPGYAVGCCGDDIIVCEQATLDLKDACREEEDPCADLRRQYAKLSGQRPGTMLTGLTASHPGKSSTDDETRVVDIYLAYDEQQTNPSTALGRSACKQTSECEFSRTRESFKLTWESAVKDSDPVRQRAEAWHEGYDKCLEVLTTFRNKFGSTFPAAQVREWLIRWIDEHPQYQLCGLRDTLCREHLDYFGTQANLVGILFKLVQSCRNAYLNCDCFGCDENARVPLARVWLRPDNANAGQSCQIIAIDPYPPYRRPIHAECWPAPLGYVNVGRFIWHRDDEVCTAVHDLGLHVHFEKFALPTTLQGLQESLTCDLFVKCGLQRKALVFETELLGQRVVGFCEGNAPPPPPPPPPPQCPTITVTHETEAPASRPIAFAAVLNPAVPGVSFNWGVSAGTIKTGQGLDKIVVDVTGQDGQTIVAKVQVKGLDQRCDPNAEASTRIVDKPPVCPKVLVEPERDKAPMGELIAFQAKLDLPVPAAVYNWRVNPGTITSGQGNGRITVDTTGATPGQDVVAQVHITELDPRCPDTRAEGKTRMMDPTPSPCPDIGLNSTGGGSTGKPITVFATIRPLPAGVTYNWTVSAGTINSGQGTATITLDATNLQGQRIIVSLEVGGLPANCDKNAQISIQIPDGERVATILDKFGEMKDDARRTHLDFFAKQLLSDPTAAGAVLVQAASEADAKDLAQKSKDYLVNQDGIDASRLTALAGSNSLTIRYELWLVPQGANPPAGSSVSTINRLDDFTALRGIGSARAKTLADAGITTFAAMAMADPNRLKELIPTATDEDRALWISEAKKLGG